MTRIDQTPTAPATPAVAKPAAPASSASSGRLPAVKVDRADISAAGHQALAAHETTGGAHAAAQLTNPQAAALGQRLEVSNPLKFKHADTNGDGRLTGQEAKAAGLG